MPEEIEVVTPTVEVPAVENNEGDDLTALSVEELKAKAERVEAEVKELKESQKNGELHQNYLRRLEKAEAKKAELSQIKADDKDDSGFTARDLIALDRAGIDESSDKAKVVQRYIKGGLSSNVKEALEHVGVKAEFDAIDAKNTVRATIDENDKSETGISSRREMLDTYRATGEVPQDEKSVKVIAQENLKQFGL